MISFVHMRAQFFQSNSRFMLIKIIKEDFLRKKCITLVLFIFIWISALLIAIGSNMIVELSHSLSDLLAQSRIPHFIQMHSGKMNQTDIELWASSHPLVQSEQTVEMINIDGSNVYLGENHTAEINSVMDIDFVKQNHSMDYLLNLENQIIEVSRGEIAVPIFYMQSEKMKIGDRVRISNRIFEMDFTVVNFVRDAVMNPSIVHSKRFVVNEDDFDMLKKNIGEVEYLIEFQLTDLSKLSEFRNSYQSSKLPKMGPAIDCHLFKMINALTDGLIAAVIVFVGFLFNIVATLCIKFTVLASIEEDYREIGVMKAIGIQQKDIKRIYLSKYVVLAGFASAVGYLISLFLNQLFTANMMLYLGVAPKSILQYSGPIAAVALMFLVVIVSCMQVLRKFDNITALEALRVGTLGDGVAEKKYFSLHKSKFLNVNIFLGLRDLFRRFKMFRLLFLVFLVCSLVIIVPVNFINTIKSPGFIHYMGIGRSDIRIDLRQTENMIERFNDMITYIQNDIDVDLFLPLVASQFKVINSQGVQENINIETGDFTVFPLEYLQGAAPRQDNEIALSFLNSEELNKGIGDPLQLVIDGNKRNMVVTGIYQDVTQGGRTAKARLPIHHETALWYVVSLDVKPYVNIKKKIDEYAKVFYPARVTDLEGYLLQTLGNTIEQLSFFTIIGILIAISVIILMTFLFLKLLIVKDCSQIAIMKSIGVSLNAIRLQYITSALLVLNIGIALGTIVSKTIGQGMVSAFFSFMGASRIHFVIDPVQSYFIFPMTLMVIVTITSFLSVASINKSYIAHMIQE